MLFLGLLQKEADRDRDHREDAGREEHGDGRADRGQQETPKRGVLRRLRRRDCPWRGGAGRTGLLDILGRPDGTRGGSRGWWLDRLGAAHFEHLVTILRLDLLRRSVRHR